MYAAPAWHLVTCEYAPQLGGVADFTRAIADALAVSGQRVHVWSPRPASGNGPATIHELESGYRWSALRGLDRAIDDCPGHRRLFVQWVPHGYGYKSLNVPFCLWVRRRAALGDDVHLMVHEPFLPFDRSRIRQSAGALVHRAMLRLLLGAARRVWVSTPSFLPDVRRFAPTSLPPPRWLPVPSAIPPRHEVTAVARLRSRLAGGAPVIGHFGTCHALVAPMLLRVFAHVARERPDVRLILAGRDTEAFARRLIAEGHVPAAAIVASGERQADDLSLYLQCCDVFVQPYHDGVSARRTTLVTLLQHARAIVASSGPRSEERWRHDEALVVTPGDDAAAMAAAAVALLERPADRERLGERAAALYRSTFDVSHAVAALLEGAAVPSGAGR